MKQPVTPEWVVASVRGPYVSHRHRVPFLQQVASCLSVIGKALPQIFKMCWIPRNVCYGADLSAVCGNVTAGYICSSRGSSVDDTGSSQTNWLLACSPSNYSLLLVLTCRSHRWLGKCCCETSTSTRSHLLRRCNVPSFDVLWNPQPQRGSSTLRAEQKRLLQQHFHTSQFAIMLQYEQLWTGINTVYEYKMLVRKSLSKRQFR
jgi:hypothetical protein